MKKIVRGNDFTLRIPVKKIVNGAQFAVTVNQDGSTFTDATIGASIRVKIEPKCIAEFACFEMAHQSGETLRAIWAL